jgi:mRNA-degrading endonuclease YafQ of YafQ-DinJ toxin-antitoxin module
MRPRRVRFAAGFDRSFERLSEAAQRAIEEAVAAFIDRSREHALKPERKAGLRDIWTFRVNLELRVFYTQEKDEEGRRVSELFHVGKHDDYRTITRRRR